MKPLKAKKLTVVGQKRKTRLLGNEVFNLIISADIKSPESKHQHPPYIQTVHFGIFCHFMPLSAQSGHFCDFPKSIILHACDFITI